MQTHPTMLGSFLQRCACIGLFLAATSTACAQDITSETHITASDVYARVKLIQAELEELRRYMGKPLNEQEEIEAYGAAPREAYYQALGAYRNADRLCFEHTRRRTPFPYTPKGEIQAEDVYIVLEAVLARIRDVKDHLGVRTVFLEPPPEEGKTNTDVFCAIVQANQQLNLILNTQVAPSDVFEQVTLGMSYMSRLLNHFPEAETIPPEPEFEPYKSPSDVMRRLLACHRAVQHIAEESGLEMMEINMRDDRIALARPSDVYHIASLLVSELAYLHAKLDGAEPPRQVYYVGRKLPSHVYQRAGMLEAQLKELNAWVATEPSWLVQGSQHP